MATVLVSAVRCYPVLVKSDFLRCFSFKELPSEVYFLLDWRYCAVQFNLSDGFIPPLQMVNKLSNLIILLLLVLVIPNSRAGNSYFLALLFV